MSILGSDSNSTIEFLTFHFDPQQVSVEPCRLFGDDRRHMAMVRRGLRGVDPSAHIQFDVEIFTLSNEEKTSMCHKRIVPDQSGVVEIRQSQHPIHSIASRFER
jgi:hypothetical protein